MLLHSKFKSLKSCNITPGEEIQSGSPSRLFIVISAVNSARTQQLLVNVQGGGYNATGFGWLVRKYGMAMDNLLSVDMVLANGQRLTASPSENADLFWGVSGGGGNFGAVTSLQYRLHDVGPVAYGGAVFYPDERASEFLQYYRELTSKMPDELNTMIAFLTAPPEPEYKTSWVFSAFTLYIYN